eukprot:scaffold133232_cov28-Tisochrysis_lutea.AAC.3
MLPSGLPGLVGTRSHWLEGEPSSRAWRDTAHRSHATAERIGDGGAARAVQQVGVAFEHGGCGRRAKDAHERCRL